MSVIIRPGPLFGDGTGIAQKRIQAIFQPADKNRVRESSIFAVPEALRNRTKE
jgi:hypothetical protein